MPNGGKNDPTNQFVAKPAPKPYGGYVGPAPNPENELIDPEDPHAQRRFEMKERGGAYGDRMKVDPFKAGTQKRLSKPGMRATKT